MIELKNNNYEISRNSPIISKFDTLLGNSQLKNKLQGKLENISKK